MEANPYQPPSSVVAALPPAGDATITLRELHIRHEIQLKSIGALYLLGGFLFGLAAVVALNAVFAVPGSERALMVGLFALYAFLMAVMLVLGFGFRRLRPWVRVPGAILSGIGLLAVPIGTLIHGWILYLMFCRAGRVVLAPEYQAVIDATPGVRYRRTVGDWIATVLVFLLLLAFAAFVISLQH